MNRIIFMVMMACVSNCYAMYQALVPNTPIETDIPDFAAALQQGMQTAYSRQMMAEQLQAQRLQNEFMEMQIKHYLATHSREARDLANKQEAQNIINKNGGPRGLLKGRQSYIKDLQVCTRHGNKYCSRLLREFLNNRHTRSA